MLSPCIGYQSPQAVPRIVCLPGFDLIRMGHAHTKQILQNVKSKKEWVIADSAFFFLFFLISFTSFSIVTALKEWKNNIIKPFSIWKSKHTTCPNTRHRPVTKALPVTEATRLPPVCQAPPCWIKLGQSRHLSMPCFASHIPIGFTDFPLPWAQLRSCLCPWLPRSCSCMLL